MNIDPRIILAAVVAIAIWLFLRWRFARPVSDLPFGGQIIAFGVALLVGYLWARGMWDAKARSRIFERSSLPPLEDKAK